MGTIQIQPRRATTMLDQPKRFERYEARCKPAPLMFEPSEKDLEFIGTVKPAHVPARTYSVENLYQR